MKDERLRSLYRGSIARAAPTDRSQCPDPAQLALLADGTATEPERTVLLCHAGGCVYCRAELDRFRAVVDAADQATRPALTGRRAALAASLLLAVGLSLTTWWGVNRTQGPDTLRGSPDALALVAPAPDALVRGDVALVWRPVPGTPRYTATVLDADGRAVVRATTRDTTLTVAADSFARRVGPFQWWVSASDDDAEQRSRVMTFRADAR